MSPPPPSPASHHFLAQSPIYFRCNSCHPLTVILSVSSLRFLRWMSAPEGRDLVFTAVSSTWGAVASVWGLATYCDGCMRWSELGPFPAQGADRSYWPSINTGPGRATHVTLLCFPSSPHQPSLLGVNVISLSSATLLPGLAVACSYSPRSC